MKTTKTLTAARIAALIEAARPTIKLTRKNLVETMAAKLHCGGHDLTDLDHCAEIISMWIRDTATGFATLVEGDINPDGWDWDRIVKDTCRAARRYRR